MLRASRLQLVRHHGPMHFRPKKVVLARIVRNNITTDGCGRTPARTFSTSRRKTLTEATGPFFEALWNAGVVHELCMWNPTPEPEQ